MPLLSRRVALVVATLVVAGCGRAVGPTVPPGGSLSTLPSPAPSVATTPAPTEAEPIAAAGIDAIAGRVQGFADAIARVGTGITVYVRVGADERIVVAGLASRSPKLAMAPDVRFQIASVSKPMTATVVMSLVEAGTLSLDDPVSKWLPDLLDDGDTITVEQLLTHTSGLYNVTQLASWSWTGPTYSATELVELAEANGRAFAPGERAEYSNTGFVVLGLVIEAATGGSLRRAMREVVFRPAGMASADLGARPVTGFEQARGYSIGNDVTYDSLDGLAAAGGVVATAEDVGHFLDALMEGRLVGADSVANMIAVHSELDGDDSYGFGVDPFVFDCRPLIGHLGQLPGFASSAWRSVDGSRTVVVLVNDEPYPEGDEAVLSAALCD